MTEEHIQGITAMVYNACERLDRIERVLIAQLTERRDRLSGELTYAQGRTRPNEQHIRIIGERLATINQQLEELQ